jgi:hypothetical protein
MNIPGNSEFTSEFFDESSKAWLSNKVRCGLVYAYKCTHIHSNTKQCKKPAVLHDFCKQHYILNKNTPKNNKMEVNENNQYE